VTLVYYGQTVGWIKMKLGMKVGLYPSHIVLDVDPALSAKKAQQPPLFGPCLLWPNSWMDQDATWYGGRPRPGHIALDGDPAPPRKRVQPPIFGPCLLWRNGRWIKMPLGRKVAHRPRRHCVRWDPAAPSPRGTAPSPTFGPCLLWLTAGWINMPLGRLRR